MLYDIENQLSVAQAFTGGLTVSTNSFQKQSAEQDLSIGRRMAVVVYFSAAGAGTTHTLNAIQADVTALTTNVEVIGTIDITTTALDLGYPYEIPIPQGTMTRLHLGFSHSATGGTTTATIDAFLMPQDEITEKHKAFPKAVHSEA